jgi:hydroxymethylpyrimidine kinase/phosphomethylpyrimidine kinase
MSARRRPSALALSGWDPSGGAGAAADLRAFAKAGAWGCAAITVVTVQSTAGLRRAFPVPTDRVIAQAREILRHQDVRAIKLGALGSEENVVAIQRLVRAARLPFVMDPVLGATVARPGARLVAPRALGAIGRLAARATLVTPNAAEAEALTGLPVRSIDEAASAARELVRRGARAALVKGGHLPGKRAVDVLCIGDRIVCLSAPRFAIEAHGTGCTLASLAAGRLAVLPGPLTDHGIVEALRWAKRTLTGWLSLAVRVGDGSLVF